MLDALPVAVNLYDATPEMHVLYVNPVSLRLTAPAIDRIHGQPLREVYPRIVDSPVMAMMEEPLRTGEVSTVRHFPGSTGRTWNWTAHPLKDAAGRVTSLLVVIEDVSEHVNVRDALLDAQQKAIQALLDVSAHAEHRESLPEFFARLTQTVAGLVHAGRVAFSLWNGADLLEVQPGAHGFTPSQLRLFSVPCRPGGDGLAEQVVFSGRVVRSSLDDPVPGLEAYGPLLDALSARDLISVGWRTASIPLGSIVAFDSARAGGFTDEDVWLLQLAALAGALVYQQKQAEARSQALQEEENTKLREHALRMEVLEQAKTRFLNVASHELRGPLGVVQGYLSMINDGTLGPTPLGLRPVLPIMEAKIRQMALLVTQLVEAARLEDHRLQLVLTDLDLREVARDAVGTMQMLAPNGTTVDLYLALEEVPVRADGPRLETVLTNLLDNAFKYSPEGGQVVCRVWAEGDNALASVADTGIGIAEQDQLRLFERFTRLESPDSPAVPGTGLGLYLARELARLHGGDMAVRSVPGEGSEFTLRLPLRPSLELPPREG